MVEAAVRVVLGQSLYDAGELVAASDVLQRATQLAPDFPKAHLAYAQALLARGEFLAGWREFAWRKSFHEKTRTFLEHIAAPEWTGETIEDCRLFVLCDEGIGDAIMFARYLPQVAKRVGTIVLGWGPEHAALFRGMDGVSGVLTSPPNRGDFDAYVAICDLPHVFGTTLETVPAQVPYLPRNARAEREWRARLEAELPGKGLRVGINWSGNPLHARDLQRSLDFEQLRPLFDVDDISFVSLQKDVRDRDRAALAAATNVADFSAWLESFEDTAALIANLDVVVSVDSAVAHLAGALGATVWVLLPKPADWRWMLDRRDTPWYPTMRLIRQEQRGEWATALHEARLGLIAYL